MKYKQKAKPVAIRRLDKKLNRLELATAIELRGIELGESDERGMNMLALAKALRLGGESSRLSISTLAGQTGISYKDVVLAYRDHKRLEGIVAVAERLPAVMEGIAIDAEASEAICPACEGNGKIVLAHDEEGLPTDTRLCIPCEGKGRIRKPGDATARKQILEMMDLAGPRATPVVTNSNVLISSGSLEDTLRAARGSGNGRAKPGDVQVVEGEQPVSADGEGSI